MRLARGEGKWLYCLPGSNYGAISTPTSFLRMNPGANGEL